MATTPETFPQQPGSCLRSLPPELEQYLPIAQWHRCPQEYPLDCPDHVPRHSTTSREGTQTRLGDTLSPGSCKKLYCSQASIKVERARYSAPQLSRACDDIKQAYSMRWLGENHDSTAL